jgi:hypothetical protein
MDSTDTYVTPRVVHVKDRYFTLYIGRAWAEFPESKWHNPFHLADSNDIVERCHVAEQYEAYVRSNPDLIAALPELAGQVLGCWCRPKCPCHGDILAKLFNEFVLQKT